MTPAAFLSSIEDPEKRRDSKSICKWMTEASGVKPKLWDKIIGFGSYKYRYASGKLGESFRLGFASRAQGLSIYLMSDFEGEPELMKRIGKHKMGRCCMTFNRLSDLDEDVLKELIQKSWKGQIESEVAE